MRGIGRLLLIFLVFTGALPAWAQGVTVGSKTFTESVILGEIAARLAGVTVGEARHRGELGGTRVLWEALLSGEIDVYPEYTGTITQEILADENIRTHAGLQRALEARGIVMTAPLGFNNTYAIAVRPRTAARYELETVSDLAAHPGLSIGFSNEFLDRADGWPGLKARYGLSPEAVRGLNHDLAYRGIASGAIDVIDVYTTDAEIAHYDLVILEDDKGYFPDYRALYLYRAELKTRAPAFVQRLAALGGSIDAALMRRMNEAVKLEGRSEAAVAAEFLKRAFGISGSVEESNFGTRLMRTTRDHLVLVAVSLSAAILVAIPIGVVAYLWTRAGHIVLAAVGILQTIPSLALFVFMIPLLGIGGPPAVMALFLYSLLPIVRTTHSGLVGVPGGIRESAAALGLSRAARLRLVELPMATPSILAGVKTSAVINVGTATLAALIGAGGYGQPILTGIRLDDMGLILEGAVPAALLALVIQGLFELIERHAVPRGLRL